MTDKVKNVVTTITFLFVIIIIMIINILKEDAKISLSERRRLAFERWNEPAPGRYTLVALSAAFQTHLDGFIYDIQNTGKVSAFPPMSICLILVQAH